MRRKLTTVLLLLVLWQITSSSLGKEVILPLPSHVFSSMIALLGKEYFYTSIFHTIKRVLFALLIGAFTGISSGMLAGRYQWFDDYFTIIITFLQTIPQIAFILIFMVWFKGETALYMIILLMIFPQFYHNARNGMIHIDPELKDIITLYHHSWFYNLKKAYLPLIKNNLLSAFDNTIPLALKVGVMAEVFVSSRQGIGHALYLARVNIDMTLIFAWVIYMILLIQVILFIYKKVVHH